MRQMMKIILVAALVLALSAGVALAATINCTGGLCEGTDNRDTLTGALGFDEINGKGAADKIFGKEADDILRGDFNSNPQAVEGNDDVYGDPAQTSCSAKAATICSTAAEATISSTPRICRRAARTP
jgi:hypothetical protein